MRRFMWQIIAIVSLILVVLLAYTNITILLHRPTTPAPEPTTRSTPAQPANGNASTSIPTNAPDQGQTPPAQAALPCMVNISTWTDGSSDWKILNGALLNDASNNNLDRSGGPTIVAPCQSGA